MTYSILNISQAKDWEYYLNKLPGPQKDIYYTPSYYELYERNGDGEAYCFLFEKNNDIALYPFLMNSVNSLNLLKLDNEYYDIQGAYGYNGVVTSSFTKEFIKSFYHEFTDFCHNNHIIAEFTRFHPLLKNHSFSSNNLEIIRNRLTVGIKLNTKDLNEIFSAFSNSSRRAIKKAEKQNINIDIVLNPNISQIKYFMDLYYETMNRVNASAYLNFKESYFLNLMKLNTMQFNASYKNELIASTICFFHNNYFHYHLGASKYDYQKLRPNNLLFWEMIQYAKRQGCTYIHFGGGKSNDPEDSLLRFKSSFSNDLFQFFIGKKVYNKKLYAQLCDIWKKTKPYLNEKYGNRHLRYRDFN